MLEDWFQRYESSERALSTMYEAILLQSTRSMSTPVQWSWSGTEWLNDYNQSLQYRTISPELEEAGNFFMKRFTVRT